jgi:hypothetical protein
MLIIVGTIYLRMSKKKNEEPTNLLKNDYLDLLLRTNEKVMESLESITKIGKSVIENEADTNDPEWKEDAEFILAQIQDDAETLLNCDTNDIPEEFETIHKSYIDGLKLCLTRVDFLIAVLRGGESNLGASIEASFDEFERGSAAMDEAITSILNLNRK